MKGKSFKFALMGLAVIIILSIIMTRVTYIRNTLTTSVDNASVYGTENLTIKYYSKNINITEPIIQTTEGSFTNEGIDILKNAAKYLGRKYDGNQGWVQPNSDNNGAVDCSGLVQAALKDSGISIYGVCKRWGQTTPRAAENWLESEINSSNSSYSNPDKFFTEVGVWYEDTKWSKQIQFAQGSTKTNRVSVYNHASSMKANNDKINILKINDPITSNLRWYQYYDRQGHISTLPAGTIVCSYAGIYSGQKFGDDHMWIAIGDLGTSKASDAINKLKKLGILPNDGSKDYLVYSEGDSNYWRIESTTNTCNGVTYNGVQINNGDPNYKVVDANHKAAGAIWAFQVGNDIELDEGRYNMYIQKLDTNGNPVAGAEFEVKQALNGSTTYNNTTFYTDGDTNKKKVISEDKQSYLKNSTNNTNTVEITNIGTDTYSIKETKAPVGYLNVNNGAEIKVEVVKELVNHVYGIKTVNIIYNGKTATLSPNDTENHWLVIDKDGNQITFSDDRNIPSGTDYWFAAQFHKANGGTSAINFRYRDPKATYDLDIDKIDANDKSKYVAGAKFTVNVYKSLDLGEKTLSEFNKDLTFSLESKANGGSNNIGGNSGNPVTVDYSGTTTKDIIEIKEVTTPQGYILFEGPIYLGVYKTQYLNNEGRLILGAIEILNSEAKSQSPSVVLTGTNEINIDSTGKINNENPVATISNENGKIHIKWYNPSIEGGYELKFGKKSRNNLNAYTAGVTYKYTSVINGSPNNEVSKVTETSPLNLENVEINGKKLDTNDTYIFKEDNVGNNNIKLKNYSSMLTVHRTTASDGLSYIADYVTYRDTKNNIAVKVLKGNGVWIFEDGSSKANPTEAEKKRAIANVQFSNDGTITFIDIDEDDEPFNFDLYKVKTDGTALNATKFSVKKYVVDRTTVDLTKPMTGTGSYIHGNANAGEALSTKPNNRIDSVSARAKHPTAYVYEIHETDADQGYINVFKKNGTEIAYVQLMIYEDEDGKLNVKQEIITNGNCTSEDLEKINAYVESPTIEDNTVKLNIVNKPNDVTFNFQKFTKNKTGTAGKQLKNGQYLIKFDGNEIDDNKKNQMNTYGSVRFSEGEITTGEHTIEFYELKAPDNFENIFDEYSNVDGVITKFVMNEDGTIKITENTVRGKKYNYLTADRDGNVHTEKIEEISNYVNVNEHDGNAIYFTIYDPSYIKFTLHKMLYNNESDVSNAKYLVDAQAKFQIVRTTPTNDVKFNDYVPLDNNKRFTFFTENKVETGSTYIYNVIETKVPDGYYDFLKDKTIQVTVKMNNEGKLTATYDILNVDATTKALLKKFISLKYNSNNNTVDIYIANLKEDTYKVILHKVDKYGNEVKYPAKFDVTTTSGTRNIEINGAADITEENEIVNYNTTKKFTLVETDAPMGYDKIEGRIELDVQFNDVSNPKVIKKATVKYYDKDGNASTSVDVSVKWDETGTLPIVDLYVPNDSSEPYEFKLVKYAGNKSNKLVSDEDGEGAKFTVQRRIGLYSELDEKGQNKFDYHEAKALAESGVSSDFQTIYNDTLKDGEYIDALPLGGGFTYNYSIQEGSSKTGYINIFKDKMIEVTIKGNYDDTGKAIISEYSYKIRDLASPQQSYCTESFLEKYPGCIDLTKGTNEDGIEVVSLELINPTGYKVRVNKTDLKGNPIDGAAIEAYAPGSEQNHPDLYMNVRRDNTGTPYWYTGESTATTTESYELLPNAERIWKIYERGVESPYYNVFEAGQYIEVKVKTDKDCKITSTTYTIKNQDGSYPSNLSELLKYIKKVEVIEEDDVPIVNVTIMNPRIYKLSITKCEFDGITELSGATITLKKPGSTTEETIISGETSSYDTYNLPDTSATYIYEIKETATAKYHNNVLKDKTIKLYIRIDATGNITRWFRIYNGNTIIPITDEIYNYVKLPDLAYDEKGAPVIGVKILNPKEGYYNLKIVKTDENGTPIKVDSDEQHAKFTYSRYNSAVNKVDKTGTDVATNNNSQLTIEQNQKIEKVNQSFRYVINETQAPLQYDLYEDTIQLDVATKDDKQKLTVDKDNTVLTAGGKTITKSTENKASYANGENVSWYLDDSNDAISITLYVKNTKKEFDLALRKHITTVNSAIKYDRAPTFDISSVIALNTRNTAKYFHTKQAVTVETGDVVRYQIDVFNEADIKGYATEITDYIQDGLQFASNSSINQKYRWKFYDSNGNETTDMTKAKYAKTDYLKDTLLNENQLLKSIVNIPQTTWHASVEIECKVVKTPQKDPVYLTNRAEITDHKAVEFDSNGNQIELTEEDAETQYPKDRFPDRDSEIENVKSKYGNVMLNYDSSITYSASEYYKGYEDDDDKETVTINSKVEYKFKLTKTDDDGNPIDGAKFKIEEKVDGQYKSVFGEQDGKTLNKTTTLNEPDASGKDTVKLNTTYEYKITEKDSDIEDFDYENLLDGKYMIVNVYMNSSKQLVKGTYGKSDYLMNKYGYTLYDEETNTSIAEDETDLYGKIVINPNNSSYPPTLEITIPNEEIITGQYRINLKKFDEKGNPVSGIPFNINLRTFETGNNGEIDVSQEYSNEEGYVEIDKNNVGIQDTYTIEEIEKVDEETGEKISTGYVLISKPITLNITKGLDATNKEYMVTNINIEYTDSDGAKSLDIPIDTTSKTGNGSFNVVTKDGTVVPVEVVAGSDGTITITAKNNKKDGDYKFRIYKKYKPYGGDYTALSGAEFKVTGENSNPVTGENGYTRFITKTISESTLNNTDIFTIEEIYSGQTGVVGLKSPLKLYVTKTETDSGYEIKTIQIEDTGSGRITDPVNAQGTYAILRNVELNDETGRTVEINAYGAYNNQITIEIANLPREDSINLKIKKINAKDNSPINGIKFRAKVNNQYSVEATTADVGEERGVAYLDQDRTVNSNNTTFDYEIREIEIPSTPAGLIRLTDYGWRLIIKTKYDSNSERYVIDLDQTRISVTELGYIETNLEKRARQREIAEDVLDSLELSTDGATLTLTIKNEQTTEYGLVIRKTDMQNKKIADARFTINENGVAIATNEKIADFAGSLASKTDVLPNTTHTYEIYETAPAKDYENILENVYIELIIKIDNSGNATATYTIKPKASGSSIDVAEVKAKIQKYINDNASISSFLEKDGNNFTLNIPNPKDVTPVDITLQKYELGDLTKGVNGAEFSIRRADIEISDYTMEVSDVLSAFGSGEGVTTLPQITTSKDVKTIQIDHVEELEVGKSLYYEITESTVPGEYKSRFYQAIVKVTAVDKNTVSAYIMTAKSSATSGWDYGSRDDESDHISVETSGTTANVKWANELSYVFRLWKKSYDTTLPEGGPSAITDGAGGADFTVVSSNGDRTLVDGLIHATEAYTEDEIHSNTTYTYTIRENEAPTSPVRHYNLFKDMDIIVNVRVGDNGVLSQNNSTIEVKAQAGKTVSAEALAEAKRNVALVIDTEYNDVNVYIANKQIKTTYDIKIMKVSDKKATDPVTGEEYYKGVEGIKFYLMGNQLNTLGSGTTGSDGTVTITGLTPNDFPNNYAIAEDRTSAENAGVTPLYGWIYLKADMTGIASDMDEDEVEAYLNEKNEDGTSKRFSLEFLDSRDANNGATVNIEGKTIIIKIVNRTTDIIFNLSKTDPIGSRITGTNDGDKYYKGADFKIVDSKTSQELWDDELIIGGYTKYTHAQSNSWYEYTVREKSTAPGFINVTQGYDIRVHLQTNAQGVVVNPSEDTRTYVSISPNGIEEPIYTVNEIMRNNWVKLIVNYETETDEDSGEEIIVASNVTLQVINPYAYKVQLNKKDKNGSTPLNVASIKAERIVGADVSKIYNHGSPDDRAMVLNQIANATTNTTAVKVVDDTVELNKVETTTSEDGYLINLQGRYAEYDDMQTWRITETDVDAPYKNILKDKYIIINTYYNDLLQLAKHGDYTDNQLYNFYVIDKEGNDVTLDYVDYVEVSTQKIDGEWTTIVTIKDPMLIRMGLYKKVDSSSDEPLSGANLTLTLGNQTAEIKNGLYETEMLESELSINSTITASVRELSTVKGYTNILGDKILYYVFRNNNGKISVVSKFIIDHGNIVTSGDEYDYIMSHIDLRKSTDDEGYVQYKLYIENPTSFKFDLTKLDIDKNNLDGTEIRVDSSYSGMHILDGESNLSFVEEDVPEHEVITYTIKEIHTADGAYVNKFKDSIRITVLVQGGQVSIVKKEHLTQHGGDFTTLEHFDCYIDPADKNRLADGEMQTLVIKMENPPQIEVNLTKTTAGSHPQRLPNTKFTIVANDSHTGYTDSEGKINFIEEINEPGNYTIRVYEDSVPTKKFVNILENKYMQFDIDVAADGTITHDSNTIKFFNKDNDSYYDNDVEITGEEATKLKGYCFVNVDNNPEISKVNISVLDPVKFDMNLIKEATDGATLSGAEFEIVSVEGLFDTIHTTTDLYGEIAKSIEMARPGVYEFHITEIKPAGNQYDNVLGDNMIVIFVWLKDNGEIELIANKYGSMFGSDVSDGQKYLVQQQNGGPVSEDDESLIRSFVRVETHNNNFTQPDGLTIRVENPVQTKVDIIKRQYTSDGESEEPLADTRFTVIKNGNEMLLSNQVVNEEVEIEEHYLSDDVNYYDIYENGTNTNGAYVNILANRFIRVYTETYSDGILDVNDAEGDGDDHYFEIYENQHFGPARKLDREQYSELYSYIDVWAEPNSDGVYVLNVKVLNPITINVGALKKQYGEQGQAIPGVSVTVISENTGDHDITTKAYEDVFSEGNIKPGTYDFVIKENENPNPRYVNVLKDRYAKANVTISKTGGITCNNIKFYTDNKDDNYTNDPEVSTEVRAILQDKVYAVVDDSQRIQKITFVIQNPVTLKFIVNKLDLAEGGLEGATFDVIKYVGDSSKVEKGMTSKDTDGDGQIVFEDGDYMKAGIYRYEVTELKPAAKKYVNILDCYDDGSQYKVVIYIKLGLDGTTELVKDAIGTPYTNGEQFKYTIVNRNDANAEIPAEVTKVIHDYLSVERTPSTSTECDKIDVDVHNTPQIDIDVIKVTKDSDDNNAEKTLTGTKFSAEADGGKGLFEDIPATQDKEYRFKNVNPGRHEFYITESEGVVNGGYINVLENRYVRVYTTISEDGVMKILDNNGAENPNYFEIYEGQYNHRSGSRILDRTKYAKIYECVSVESVVQDDGVYKLNLKVNNPERNYKIKLNKKVFGEEDINMEGIQFFIRSTVDNQGHQLKTDKDGNISFEEKRVPVGIYEYYVTETNTSGPEFVNILENNYILVRLKVNQDGSIEIVDINNVSNGNENKYYILDAKNTTIIDEDDTIVDDFVRVATDNEGDEPELDFYIKDPERINLKLVKRDVLTNEKMNNVTFTTNVFYQSVDATADPTDADKTELVNAETFEKIDISTIKTDTVDGVDGVILVPDILIDKTGTYTFVFHEESTDGLFKYLYKSHAEDITLKIDISVETNNEGRPIGYKVGQPRIVTGAKYVDDESTLTTQAKAQLVRAEVLNSPIRGHYDLVLSKLDKYSNRKLDGAEFDIRAEKDGEKYELYDDVEDLRIENTVIPDHFTVRNGELKIENIRITPPPYQAPAEDGTLETFNIILTETKAPAGYMLLDEPIVLEVTTAVDGEYDDAEYVLKSVNLVSGDNYGLVTKTFGKNEINVVAKNEYFDLALRKSIVSVAYSDSDEAKITEEETEDRIPVIYEDDEIYNLNPGVTTANYRHVKNHVRVYPGQEVIYCLRVYNEGEIDGYAEKITDHLPEGLIFLPEDKFNQERGWTYDLTDQTLKTVYTTFLSKENNPNNDRFNAENNLIKAMDENVATGVNHNLDYKEIEIKCKVSDNLRPGVILTNIAEITEYKAEGRTQETVDRDSDGGNADVPEGKDLQNYKEDELTDNREDYVPGQEDDDDFEKLIVVEFDLALRKYITAINEEEVLADEKEAKYTDEVVEDTEDILGEGTASDDTEGTNEGANTNIVDESESENGNTEGVDAEEAGENPDENKVADEESDEEDTDDDNTIKYDREPRVNVSTLKSGDLDSIYKDPDEPTTALYNHTKDPVEVSVDDIVTYTLEVFNEGTVDGYASLIKDDIPEGVEFVPYTEGDGSVNDKYRWKMVDENDEEVTDPKDAKYVVSDYLSKDNETEENSNLIRAFDPATGTRLDSKYVQVQFRVICKQDYPKLITNYAQISDDSDDDGKSVRDRDSHPNEWIEGEDDQDIERIWVTYMDLALRKFITGVTDFKTGKTEEITYRIPQVDPTALIDETGTTAKYEHTKEPVLVHTNDVVIYTLRIYNEGSKDGYATQIKDDLPEGLEFLPDHEVNKYYEWSLVDKNDKPVTRLEDAEYAVTNYLSKDNETEERQNLLKSFDYYDYENDTPAKRETPEYKDIMIAFKVTEPQTSDRILINEAQISEQTDAKGVHREDRDSTPNIWLGEDDEDIEKVRVLYFDLALRKWVTKAIVTQDGKETVFETGHHAEDDPEDVVKVDLKKSKINKVVVKFEYQIRITNEGEIDGYAKEIKDRIPEGLRFDPADNPTWTQLEENIIVTDELKDTLLKPGESAEVTVVLTWINSGDNLGLKVNVAEISKDYNDYGTHDIDSTPDNNVWGEDDIDDAPVMLAVKTGNAVFGYIAIAVFVAGVIVIGVRRIKKINEG